MNDTQSRILHITDLHFFEPHIPLRRLFNKRLLGYWNAKLNRARKFDFSTAEQFLKFIGKESIDTVIVTGDVTTTADIEEFKKAKQFFETLKQQGVILYLIPGNHDYYTFESVRLHRFEKSLHEFVLSDNYPVRTQLPTGHELILLQSARANLLSSRGILSIEQISQLDKWITELEQPTIIACHYPVLHRTPEYYSSFSRRLINANRLKATLQKTKVPILYLTGHVHRYSYVQDKINPLVTYLCSPPLFYKAKRGGGFCIIKVSKLGFDVQLITWKSLQN